MAKTNWGNLEVVKPADMNSIGEEINSNTKNIGDLDTLKTTGKDNLVIAINELFISVSDGKSEIAAAITDRGIPTAANDTFEQMADNILNLTTSTTGKEWFDIGASNLQTNHTGMAYGKGIYVATTASNSFYVSDNGVIWEQITPANMSDKVFSDVCFNGSIFVAVGRNRSFAYSSDGRNWTLSAGVTGDAGIVWEFVAYGNGIFLATSVTGATMTSTDGNNWMYNDVVMPKPSLQRPVFGATVFVTYTRDAPYQILFSSDGQYWEAVNSPKPDTYFEEFVWNGEQFLSINNGNVITSVDGLNWVLAPIANISFSTLAICYGYGIYAAGGNIANDGTYILTSKDGLTWERVHALSGVVADIRFDADLFLAYWGGTPRNVTFSGNLNITGLRKALDKISNDGKAAIATAITNQKVTTFANDSYGKMADNIARIPRNIAATDWASVTLPFSIRVTGCAWGRSGGSGKGGFAAVGNTYSSAGTGRIGMAMWSVDGKAWAQCTNVPVGEWTAVAYSKHLGKFTAVGAYVSGVSQYAAMESSNGRDWTPIPLSTIPATTDFIDICDNGEGFYAFTQNGDVWMTSKFGEWYQAGTNVFPDRTEFMSFVAHLNNRFIAGSGSSIWTSTDDSAINWTRTAYLTAGSITCVTYANGYYVALGFTNITYNGKSGQGLRSVDGVTWEVISMNGGGGFDTGDRSFLSITYGRGLYVAVSNRSSGPQVAISADGMNWVARQGLQGNHTWSLVVFLGGIFMAFPQTMANSYMYSGVMYPELADIVL